MYVNQCPNLGTFVAIMKELWYIKCWFYANVMNMSKVTDKGITQCKCPTPDYAVKQFFHRHLPIQL